jgi:hypothetical protein
MITVSHGAGLHSQESDADDFWSRDMDKQWRKPRIQLLKAGVAQMQRAFRCAPGSISPATASAGYRPLSLGTDMGRREFIGLVGGAAAAWLDYECAP